MTSDKQIAAQNEIHAGMLARSVVLKTESVDRFRDLLAVFHNEYQPDGPTENALVEIMVVARWRLLRLSNMECAVFDYDYKQRTEQDGQMPAPASLVFRGPGDKSRWHDLLNRYESRLNRQFKGALNRLERIRRRRAKGRVGKQNSSAIHLRPDVFSAWLFSSSI